MRNRLRIASCVAARYAQIEAERAEIWHATQRDACPDIASCVDKTTGGHQDGLNSGRAATGTEAACVGGPTPA